jgi:hypothetical protein
MSEEKQILAYDLAALPKNAKMNDIIEKYKKEGVIVYCSKASGNYSGKDVENPVKIFNPDGTDVKFIDTSLQNQ